MAVTAQRGLQADSESPAVEAKEQQAPTKSHAANAKEQLAPFDSNVFIAKEQQAPSDSTGAKPEEQHAPSDSRVVKPKVQHAPSDSNAVKPQEQQVPSESDAVKPKEQQAQTDSDVVKREQAHSESPAIKPKSKLMMPVLAGWALLAITAVVSFWGASTHLVAQWWNDPDYLHGFLVPVFAGYLLWQRRDMLTGLSPRGSWWGLALIALAGAMRCASAYYYYELLDPAAMIPCLAGLALFVGGWKALRWAGPSIAFLAFMIPLPGFVATLLGYPLQRTATIASTYMIQTVGVPAVAEGNVIYLGDSQIGVAEACNGLRNMMLFLAVGTAVALSVKRSPIEKAIIVLSSAPIAVIANVVRITATGVLHSLSHHELADTTYHDLAGWFMMPLAVLLLWGELALLRRIFVPATASRPLGI
jgi:exosortase